MDERFKSIVENILLYEGGYINNPSDPGGETNFGISKRSYPMLDIKNITREDAIDIYYSDYYLINNIDAVCDYDIATKLMNMFVNMGAKNAQKIMCRSLRACDFQCDENTPDISKLISVINDMTKQNRNREILVALRSEMAGYYRSLAGEKPTLKTFLKGWLKRAYS